MLDLRVIGVEPGSLLLATDGGTEFRLPVTASLAGQVRQANPDATPQKRVSPKDVQARIRGGADAADVAAAYGVEVESIRRFEGPVLAERAFVLDAARRVPVTPADDAAPDTFGDAITAKLEAGDATDIAWASWKHPENGWQVQVRYTAAEVEHDAQWRFDPKTATLVPDNGDAHRLSRAEDEGIAPRLRAVEAEQPEDDGTRFDSGAFQVEQPVAPQADEPRTSRQEPAEQRASLRPQLPRIGTNYVEERAPGNETADLLEALRRRRGEREAASFSEQDDQRASGVVDIPLQGMDEHDTAPQPDTTRSSASSDGDGRSDRRKRTRRAMPSWDEIVFGTRPDDDMA
jgi:hypothetical protein